ncbi:MAG: DUF1223 domain-containing protein [Gammaproteobacteria bacterium]
MRYIRLWWLLAIASLAPLTSGATVFASGARQVSLIELYTSEGCSSCPPADRWLSRLKQDPGLWRDFVPVAFHVDYWDSLGWKDRFAADGWSARQRRYAADGGISTVYTPGLLLNGKDWRRWGGDARPGLGAPAGALRAELSGDELVVSFAANVIAGQQMIVNVALLGTGLSSTVKAGENRGVTLDHDFVVLGLARQPLAGATGAYTGTVRIPSSPIRAPRRALAIWVSSGDSQAPLQAAGGWLAAAD